MIIELGNTRGEAHWQNELTMAAKLLARMPKRRRRIFLSHVMAGETYSDIARNMSLSLKTVKRELLLAFQTCAAFGEKQR